MEYVLGLWAPGPLSATAAALLASLSVAAASPPDELVAAARKEGSLVVMALPRDWCDYGRIIDRFKAEYGLTVDERDPQASSAEELDAIRAGRDKGDAQAPDVVDVGLSFAASARDEGLLQPFKVSVWETIPDRARDPDGYWYGGYYGVLVFAVNADGISRLPTDWEDLASAEYRNAIGLAGSIGSNQTILTVLAAGLSATKGNMEDAAQRGLDFFAGLQGKGNLVPMLGTAETLADGRTPILVRWDYLAFGDRDALKNRARIEVVRPSAGLVAGVYTQAISAFARHPNAARLWMEHFYSDEAQLIMLQARCQPIRLNALLRAGEVPANLQQDLHGLDKDRNGGRTEPVFPTPEEQERAKDVIIKGWDSIVGVPIIECQPAEEPDPGPISQEETGGTLAARGPQCRGVSSVQ